MRKINLVILGCGSQGSTVLRRYRHLYTSLKKIGVELTVFALIDGFFSEDSELYNKNYIDNLYREIEIINSEIEDKNRSAEFTNRIIPRLEPQQYTSFDEFAEKNFYNKDIDNPFLIYDATPTNRHQRHIETILFLLEKDEARKDKIFYFGEKPLLLDEDQLISLPPKSEITIWCNFIELYSPAFLAVKKFFKENRHCFIKKIRFWRVSTIGLEKVFSSIRPGVIGGSLEDKMIHDIALASGIISQGSNKTTKTFDLKDAMIHSFMPASVFSIAGNLPLFMAVNGQATNDLEECGKWPVGTGELIPADASFILKMKTETENNTPIDIDFYSSWVGLSDFPGLRILLKKFSEETKHSKLNWINKTKKQIPIDKLNDITYSIEEARVCLIQGEVEDEESERFGNKYFSIACNFLDRKDKGISPQAVLFIRNQQPRILEPASEVKLSTDTALERIFVDVILNCLGIEPSRDSDGNITDVNLITNDYILRNHKILLDARNSALQKSYNTSIEAEKCNNKFKSFLRSRVLENT